MTAETAVTRGRVVWELFRFAAAITYFHRLSDSHGWLVVFNAVGLLFCAGGSVAWVMSFPLKRDSRVVDRAGSL